MKKSIIMSVVLASALALAGCGQTVEQRTQSGALIGGATGAVIGGTTTGNWGGAAVGGVIGAIGGAMVGAAIPPQQPEARCAKHGHDQYGNVICLRYY